MKKIICFVVCCIAVLAVTSCGNNSNSNNNEGTTQDISVTGADGTIYHSYQTACSNGDYDAARDYIGKMKLQLASMDNVGIVSEKKKEAYEEFVKEEYSYSINGCYADRIYFGHIKYGVCSQWRYSCIYHKNRKVLPF